MCNSPRDGHARAEMSTILDMALLNLFEAAVNKHGAPQAACIMWTLVSRDPKFKHPYWMELVFKRHRNAILQDFRARTEAD